MKYLLLSMLLVCEPALATKLDCGQFRVDLRTLVITGSWQPQDPQPLRLINSKDTTIIVTEPDGTALLRISDDLHYSLVRVIKGQWLVTQGRCE